MMTMGDPAVPMESVAVSMDELAALRESLAARGGDVGHGRQRGGMRRELRVRPCLSDSQI
jgi:hypothetical protein